MTRPSKQESKLFMRTLAIRNPDLFGTNGNVYEWIAEGWRLDGEPSPEQIAAALFMEARTQDDCVIAGESDASYPIRLRELAYQIIDFHHEED